MTNIPTELLRTLIAVVDLRSFTRAANSLGITQPAVSAQIKRLQFILGSELFDKSAPGVTLTDKGRVIVDHARKLLAVNDDILSLTAGRPANSPIQVGMPHDYFEREIFRAIQTVRARHPGSAVHVRCAPSDQLFRDLRVGEMDIVVGMTDSLSLSNPFCSWSEQVVFAAAKAEMFEVDDPIPIVAAGPESLGYRLAVAALDQVGRQHEVVYLGRSLAGAIAATEAGLGLLPTILRAIPPHLAIHSGSARLPALPEIFGGIYLRAGSGREALEELGNAIAAAIRPDECPAGPESVPPLA